MRLWEEEHGNGQATDTTGWPTERGIYEEPRGEIGLWLGPDSTRSVALK